VKDVVTEAAWSGFVNILDYVIEQGEVLSRELSTEALLLAGCSGQLPAAQWLRQHGGQWPAVLTDLKHYCRRWPDDVITWAIAEGYTSPIAL
jgi:hypothetical protein